jgi:hypothetical protein
MLNGLSDNGGYGQTQLPDRLSPALNKIPRTEGSTDFNGAPLADQRGIAVYNRFKDIGACELVYANINRYVNAETGNDLNNGLEASPWKTISYALNNTAFNDTIRLEGDFLMTEDSGISLLNGYEIKKDISLIGVRADSTSISASATPGTAASRIFTQSESGYILSVENLTLKNGYSENGGGILTNGGLILNRVEITGCGATGDGGAIWASPENRAILNISNTTISDNFADDTGGGIYCLTFDSATVNLTNTTITGNTSENEGGGLFLYAYSSTQDAILTCSINSSTTNYNTSRTNNTNGTHAKAYEASNNAELVLDVRNCIIADADSLNYSPETYNGGYINLTRSFTLCSDNSLPADGSGNVNSTNPMLAPLDYYNGGSTRTHALYSGSPAVDAIALEDGTLEYNGASLLDQNGVAIINNLKDIGSFEGFIIGTLEIPQNVVSSVAGSTLTLTWDAVVNATGYKVYSSDDPYTGFAEELTVPTGESWSIEVSGSKKFYYVVAVNDAK